MATGEVKKLRIIAYKDEEFKELAFGNTEESTYTTMVNPETIKYSVGIKLVKTQPPNTEGNNTKPEKATPPSISIQFLFDGTGIFPGTAGKAGEIEDPTDPSKKIFSPGPVTEQIEKFKKYTYQFASDTHQPYYVKILYGVIVFKGVLETVDFDYKLFAPSGEPLRVTANTKFIGTVDDDLRAALQNFNSPDLTHIRQVKEGDTLPLMCNKIYGNSKYYLEVAQVNNITNFRKLTPGQRINFPPIEKLS